MENLQILFFILLIHICASQTNNNNVPNLLANETNIGGAGVRARLSQKGVNYLARVISNTLLADVSTVDVGFEPADIHLASEKVSMASMKLIFHSSPKVFHTKMEAPNNIIVEIPDINVTGKSELSVPGVPTTVIAELSQPSATVRLNVSVLRSAEGAPRFGLNDCKVISAAVNESVDVNLDGGSPAFTDDALKQQLKDSLGAEGAQLLSNLICARVKFVLEDRVNNRFALIPTKLTLAKVSENILLGDLANRLRSAKVMKDTPMAEVEAPIRARRAALISSFNVTRAESLYLDYTLVSDPRVSALGLELESAGEVSIRGEGHTPFGPQPIPFPKTVNEEFMLQMAVSDFMTNSLLYHGHTVGLFNTRVDPKTPHFGPIMRTSCSMGSRLMFCLGDLFPTLRRIHPDRRLALFFDTVQAPVIQFRAPSHGGITFALLGKIVVLLIDKADPTAETKVAEMAIDVKAHMKLRLSNTDVRPKITLDSIKLTTLSPGILLQDELDDAVLLAREVLQRMVNDILSDGIPVPLHPVFKLNKPKIKIIERALLLQTNFELNESLLQQITAGNILDRTFASPDTVKEPSAMVKAPPAQMTVPAPAQSMPAVVPPVA